MATDAAPIELRQVTGDNFDAVIALRVADDQRDFLHPVVESLAWAYVAPQCHPLAIYAGDSPAGFVMYGHEPAEGRCWIVGFMVDACRQRRGVGRAALELLLARMEGELRCPSVALSVHPDNVAALRLYQSFGFQDTGKCQDGELILRRSAATG